MHSRRPAAGLLSGLVSTLLCCLLVATPAASALQGGNGPRGAQAKENHPTKGAPGQNLPNLDEVRRRGPANPKALPPVPSKLKKCPPDEPNCNAPAGAGNLRADAGHGSHAAEPSRAYSLFGLLAAGVSNPYSGVMLASARPGLPEPPRTDGAAGQGPPPAGWLSSLASLFGAGAAARRMPMGGFENADCYYAWGYAWDSAQPNVPVIVALYDNNQPEPIATALANRPRPDLVQMTGGDGRHGFRFELPESLRDGASHSLSVKIQGTGFTLANSPKVISSCTVSYQGAITSADCDQVTGWAWDAGRPATPIDVDVFVDGIFAARASADVYNAQLGKGDNRHQFRVPTPLAARDGQAHAVTVRPSGSGQAIAAATSAACNGPSHQGFLEYADCDFIAGWVVDWNRPNTPVDVDVYADGVFVTRVLADNFRQDIANLANDNGRHGFVVPVPDSLRDGVSHHLTARPTGSAYQLTTVPGPINCSARAGCSASQDLASTEFVKGFYLGALARQPRPVELQYWNDALRAAAPQGQTALWEKAKLLGRELFLGGEYANRGRMTAGQEANYASDLYWGYMQRGPDASGQSWWAGNIQSQNSQGLNGWLNALVAFEGSDEFKARVASVCPAPTDSVRDYDTVSDFSPLQNPDGAWTYGYRATGGSFTAFPSRVNVWGAGTDSWSRGDFNGLFVTRNNTGSVYTYPAPSVVHPVGVLNLHPGPGNEKSVVRWTAAAAGTYVITGYFKGIDTVGTTTDVAVTHNGVSLISTNVNGYGAAAPFSLTRTMTAGDTLEFVVGVGSNGHYNHDSTGLAVTISQPPPAQTQPYAGAAAQAPGKIEAELFDAGGEGVAYHDTTAGTHGQDYDQPPSYPAPSFRQPTDVDIYKQAASYSNGYLVVMQAGDWMKYTVDVAQPGSYTLSAQTYYWGSTGGTFHVEVDGADVTGPLQLAGGSTWQTLSKPGVQLNAGRRVLRVVCDSNASDSVYMGDIDYLRLTPDGETGLLGYWKFDEGAGSTATDSSGGAHPGTLQAGAGWATGASGSAAALDGADDYVQMGANGFAVSSGLTVSAWLYPTGAGSDGVMGGIIVNREGEYELARFPNGTIQWAIANQSPGWNWVNTGYVAPLNQWTHITVTYDGSAGKTYANGQLVHTAAATGVIGDFLPAQNDFRVGGRQGLSQNFAGRLDEVRVYNRALTQAEVGALPGVPSSGLAGHWKFDEAAGSTAADSSGGGNGGTLQGGASWGVARAGTAALSFDGADDFVQMGARPGLSMTTAATFGAWLYPTGAGSDATMGGIVVNKEGEYEIARFPNGTIQWAFANTNPGWNWVNTGYVAPLNQWTHITITYDNGTVKTYANGQLVHTFAGSGAVGDFLPAQNDFRVGGRQGIPQYFAGRLDEVRVYNRALSAAEVGTLMVSAAVDPTGNDFSEAKKDPANETGSGGDDPLSRNFNFSIPLVGLKGRAGLDLGLSLSYNSLVWTRDAATGAVKFDSDYGDPSPGFRLGLPVIHRKYRNARNENAYMLVTPSGGRVELRQAGASNTYEATDSSYTQLTEGAGLTLRPTDGSQLSFELKGYEYKCKQIKDRNGNFISLSYNAAGDVSSITDTLGRVITFSYDANGRPTAIEQNRNGQVHQWATFGYANVTMGAQFADPSKVTGPANGTPVPVLNRVSLDDGSFYAFLYNAWGQVYRVERRAADGSPAGRLLSYTEYDLQTPTAAQTGNWTDCPRFTRRNDFVKDWNGDAPVVTTYSKDPAGFQIIKSNRLLDGGGQAVDTADTVTQEIVYGPANTWKKGLVAEVRTSWQGTLRRTAKTTWAQDDESLAFPLNPRVKETEVSDPQGNRTGKSYTYTSFGLPVDAIEWAGPQAQALRRTHTEYNLDPAYVSRRVLGLVSSTSVYDGQGHVASKVDYTYDQGGQFLQHQGEPAQHDGTNYGASFVIGRGLLTSVRRWDVTALHDITKSVESRAGYNTTGSAVFSRDPEGHESRTSYTDRFSDKSGANALAFPTTLTDPDGFSSKAEYSFHTGLVTRTEDPRGAQQTFTYDAAGRAVRVERSGKDAATGQVVNGGYTRWVYGDAMDAVQSWTKVDAGMPEVCSISVVDGGGRARATASDFPGSQGGYRAQYSSYDIAGRSSGQTNPTEVNGLWNPSGDDAAAGWKWTTQTFDWKSRPLVTTLPKLLNPSDPGYASEQPVTREVSYEGCGCAGGEVVTVRGEMVPTNEPSPAPAFARRTQRVRHDSLGRAVLAEILKWDGAVYTATTTKYNALDRPLRVRQYAGTAPPEEPEGEGGDYHTTLMTYDGHGRLKTRRLPQYDPGASDSYTYFADDTVETATEPRGIKTEMTYDGRHHVRTVAHRLPGAPVSDLSVTFVYDAAGNRTSMADGEGTTTYHYDALSRMDWEKREFDGLTDEYKLKYAYNLGGALTRMDYPGGAYVTYQYDSANSLTAVTGAGSTFGQGVLLASGMKRRAWGGLKEANYADGVRVVMSYDARLRPARRDVTGVTYSGMNPGSGPSGAVYSYYADGRLRYAQDIQDGKFDRAYAYDHAGRLKEAYTGQEARGGAQTHDRPYQQSYGYDVWGNMNSRGGFHWTGPQTDTAQYSYNRRQGWAYDAAGRVTADTWEHTYDAAGQKTKSRKQSLQPAPSRGPDAFDTEDVKIEQAYDGAGASVSRVVTTQHGDETGDDPAEVETEWTLRSTVLGGAAAYEEGDRGSVVKVYAGGEELLRLMRSGTAAAVEYRHADPLTGAWVQVGQRREPDPLGSEAGGWNPYVSNDPPYDPLDPTGSGAFKEMGDIGDIRGSCVWNSMPVPCSFAMGEINRGAADVDTSESDPMTLAQMGAVFVPDYNDASQDHAEGDSIVGVILGRYEFTGLGTTTTAVARIKAPLTESARKWYEARKRYAQELMGTGTKCREFLAANFDFTEVARALEFQKPYDGLRSTISLEEAGLVSPGFAIDDVTRKIADQPVYEKMIGNRAVAAINNVATRYDVYFDPRKMTANTLIHEALHGATLLNDLDLAKKLTGVDYEKKYDIRISGVMAAIAISDTLARNGCGRP